ncbi:MAG: hypothetical protein AABW64_03820 [Nanoarchaeota archaeon]
MDVEEWDAFGRPEDSQSHEPMFNQEKNIKTYTDLRTAFEQDEYYVEIVFGKDKVFLMVHTEKDRQQKIANILSRHTVLN